MITYLLGSRKQSVYQNRINPLSIPFWKTMDKGLWIQGVGTVGLAGVRGWAHNLSSNCYTNLSDGTFMIASHR